MLGACVLPGTIEIFTSVLVYALCGGRAQRKFACG